MRKHPAQKKPITPLTVEELQIPCKGINSEVFRERLKHLKHDTAPGIGCIRNEHLLVLVLDPDRQMTPSAAAAVDHFFDYANVKVEMSSYYYPAFVVCCLVPASKVDPAGLPPGATPDCRYITSTNQTDTSSQGHTSMDGFRKPTTVFSPQSRMASASVGEYQ